MFVQHILETAVDKHYTVALEGWPELSSHDRIAAEVRYATELERAFGTPAQVSEAWWADYAAFEEWDATLNEGSKTLDGPWQAAERAAEDAGWRGLPARPKQAHFRVWVDDMESVFEVRPEHVGVGSAASG